MQRLALFDLDGTLVDRKAAFRAWAEEFVGTHRLDGDALSRLLAADARFAGPRGPFFVAVREAFGLGRTPDELWRQYRGRMPELVTCRARDLEALRLLRVAGWTIGIVTNGMTDNQHGKIHRAGLAPLVDAWCISEEAGHRKPGPAIFALAARRCGTSITRGGWMTGDDPVLDIAGGRQAGLRTIWLSTGSTAWPGGGPGPDHTAATVADAVTVLLREPP